MFEIGSDSYLKLKDNRSIYKCYLYKINSISEIKKYIDDIRKKHLSSSHICYAYRYYEKNTLFEYSSDAREPHGSAGRPMLNELKSKKIINAVIYVIRYFGGKKIGIPGLIDIYSKCAIMLIDGVNLNKWKSVVRLQLKLNYQQEKKIKYILDKKNIEIINKKYDNLIHFLVEVEEKKVEKISKLLLDRFNNKISIKIT